MIRSNYIIHIFFFVLISILLFTMPVYANSNNDYNDRITKNSDIITKSNNMSALSRARYSDKYLKDLKETNYQGLSSSQQQVINNLATSILQEDLSVTNSQKIEAFYNWILTNFYYYQTPSEFLGSKCDNPYYLYTKKNNEGQIRARSNGYASMLVALARSQGIEARILGTYYNEEARNSDISWDGNFTETSINHKMVQAYIDNEWIVLDPSADSYQTYDTTNLYQKLSINKNDYLNPTVEELSKTHLMLKYYPGSKSVRYLTNTYENKKIKTFLNKIRIKKTNGKKVNSLYNYESPQTWFAKTTNSRGDGLGNASKIFWASNKYLYGSLNLSNFSSLKVLSVPNNKITSLDLSNTKSMAYVTVYNNRMSKIVVTGSPYLVSLSAKNNPATYIKYNFGKTKRVATIKAGKGGTVSVKYYKTSKGKYYHGIKAVPKSGYKFLGWYKNGVKISSKASTYRYKTTSFTYVALFKKKPKTYIYISIKNQKLYYYKNKKLFWKSNIVSGKKNIFDTLTGNFKIVKKVRYATLKGRDYECVVDYWMLFDSRSQSGLHDAKWLNKFGGDIYKTKGSHGCVNLPYSTAKVLYKNAKVGTPVIIK